MKTKDRKFKMTCFVCNLTKPVENCIFCKELDGETLQIIRYRYDTPNKYDQAEFGAIIRINKKDDSFDIYRNISHDTQDPVWEYEGNFTDDLKGTKYYPLKKVSNNE